MQHTRINGVASSSPRLSNLHGNGDTMIWGYDDEIHCYSLYRCAAILSVDAADTTINIAEWYEGDNMECLQCSTSIDMNVEECGAVCSRVCRDDLCIVLCAPNRIRRLTPIDATEISINSMCRDYENDMNQGEKNIIMCCLLHTLSRVVTLGSDDEMHFNLVCIGVWQCFRRWQWHHNHQDV